MTRWSSPGVYEGHYTTQFYTFANKSTEYFPTLNCSRPLKNTSTLNNYLQSIQGSNDRPGLNRNQIGLTICEEMELTHMGAADVRVKVGAVEGFANESQGKILSPGETWHIPYRVHDHLTVYTSSNVSQQIEITMAWYR